VISLLGALLAVAGMILLGAVSALMTGGGVEEREVPKTAR